MSRASILLTVAALAATAGLASPVASEAATCAKPQRMVVKQVGATTVAVSWAAPRGAARGPFRVLRDRAVVGQTRRTSMKVRVRPGAPVRLSVGLVAAGGRAPRCWARSMATVQRPAATAPSLPAPARLVAQDTTDTSVTLTWRPVDGATAYRVSRDGVVVGQTTTNRMRVAIAASRISRISVAAVAARGGVSTRAATVLVRGRHRAPGAPGDVAVTDVTDSAMTITWRPAAAGSAPLRGYRVTRDGAVVRQVPGLALRLENLKPLRGYTFTVAAVDTQGHVGPRVAVSATTTAPATTRGKAHAFLLASTDSSFDSFRRHYDRIGVVYPTYYNCDPADPATIAGGDDARITAFAKARGVLVLPRVDCQRPAVFRRIFAEPALRRAWVDGLVALAERHDYDGVSLDFEAGAPSDRDAYTAFVTDVAAALHAKGRKLSVVASPKVADVPNHPRSTFFDYAALSQRADWVFVMGWGIHWATSTAGPVSDMTWVSRVISYTATMPRKDRFVFGMPLYAMDWSNGGGPLTPAAVMPWPEAVARGAAHGASPERDPVADEAHIAYSDAAGTRHDVWYLDVPSIERRVALARANGIGGVGFWRLGQEDPSLWDSPLLSPR